MLLIFAGLEPRFQRRSQINKYLLIVSLVNNLQVWNVLTGECLFTGSRIPVEYDFPGFKGGSGGLVLSGASEDREQMGVVMSTDTSMTPSPTRGHPQKDCAYLIEGSTLHMYRLIGQGQTFNFLMYSASTGDLDGLRAVIRDDNMNLKHEVTTK